MTAPLHCGAPMLRAWGEQGCWYVCAACGLIAGSLPGKLSIPDKRLSGMLEREEDVQRAIIDALRASGRVVLQTSEHRRGERCPHCGERVVMRGGRGCDRGVPDLLVSVRGPDWRALEVKGARTRVSPEQRALAGEGRIVIVRSVEEALAAMEGGKRG